jgi:hypothetical protein
MSTSRPRIIASLCLLLAVGAFAAAAVLLRPEPAGAASTRSRRVAFSPLWVAPNQGISYWFVNSGSLPTPPATVTFVNVLNGSVFGELSLMSEAPGRGRGDQINNLGPGAQLIATFVTFNQPTGGQAIPSPLAGNVQVWDGQKPVAVIGPAQ